MTLLCHNCYVLCVMWCQIVDLILSIILSITFDGTEWADVPYHDYAHNQSIKTRYLSVTGPLEL